MSQTPPQPNGPVAVAAPPSPIFYYFQKRIGGWAVFWAFILGSVASYSVNAASPPLPNDYMSSLVIMTLGYSIFCYPFFSSLMRFYYYGVKKGKPSNHISREDLETLDQITPQEFDAYFKRAALCKYAALGLNVGILSPFILCGNGEGGMMAFPVFYLFSSFIIHAIYGAKKKPLSQMPVPKSANAGKVPEPNPILYYFQKRIGGWAIFFALILGSIASYVFNAEDPPLLNDYWWQFSRLLIGYSIFTYPFFSSLLSFYYYSVKKGKPSDHISREDLETLDQITPQEFDFYFKRVTFFKYITLGFNAGIWGLFILCGNGELGMILFPLIYFFLSSFLSAGTYGVKKKPARVFKWKPDHNPRPMRMIRHRYNSAASDFTGGAIYDRVEW